MAFLIGELQYYEGMHPWNGGSSRLLVWDGIRWRLLFVLYQELLGFLEWLWKNRQFENCQILIIIHAGYGRNLVTCIVNLLEWYSGICSPAD